PVCRRYPRRDLHSDHRDHFHGRLECLHRGERGGHGRVFNGTIDDVRVYNVALSASQVSALYYESTTYTWLGTTTSWTTAANWSPYGPPGSGDTAVVVTTSSSTYPLLTAPTSCKNLQI